MSLLPFDLTLTVGVSAATFLLGVLVWWRKKGAMGNALYGLIAITLSFWTTADWILRLRSTALPLQVSVWKLLFYLGACFGPGLVIHASSYIARRTTRRITIAYALGTISFLLIAFGFEIRFFRPWYLTPEPFFAAGAILGLVLYAAAVLFMAMDLYPILHSPSSSETDRRRATYGIMIFVPYLIAGALQFIAGPLPTGLFMPILETWFLGFSLMSFIRVAFLDVEFSPLEAFLLFLASFATVVLLRSRDAVEALIVFVGAVVVGIFGVVAVAMVRGERAKRRILEEANKQLKLVEEAKSDFVDMVAHQLRSPLGGIRASASMLEEGDFGSLPDSARKSVKLIKDSASRLLTLADTYLDASRLEVGKFESVRTTLDVRGEIARILDEMSMAASAKKVELVRDVPASFPSALSVDGEVLHHALFNLVDNAIKYTDKGRVTVAVRYGKDLVIEVSDTGMGLTEEERRGLFNKFHRGRSGHAHTVDGTGLGLYIVKRLVEAAGGSIAVSSAGPGKGTTFRVVLPAVSVDAGPETEVR